MTTPIPEDTTGVTPQHVVNKAGETTAEHTPPQVTPPQPPPATPVNPGAAGDERITALEGIVTGLATTVTTLTDTVTKLIAKDESPRKRVPWTHKGGVKRDE